MKYKKGELEGRQNFTFGDLSLAIEVLIKISVQYIEFRIVLGRIFDELQNETCDHSYF